MREISCLARTCTDIYATPNGNKVYPLRSGFNGDFQILGIKEERSENQLFTNG